MNNVVSLYDSIILMDETTGLGRFVGLYSEDDENTDAPTDYVSLGGAFLDAFSGDVKSLKKQIEDFLKYQEKLGKVKGGTNKVKWIFSYFKLLALIIARVLGSAIHLIFQGIDKLWELIKKIPGVEAVSSRLYKFFFTKDEGKKERMWKVAGKEYPVAKILKGAIVALVLGGVSGKIIAAIKKKLGKTSAQEETFVVTEPLVLPYSEADEVETGESFVKKAPGILAKLVNFAKDIKDETMRLLVGFIALVVAIGIFFALLIGFKPLFCKAIKYVAAIRSLKNSDANFQLKGFEIAKYTLAQLPTVILELLERKNIIAGIIDDCECVKLGDQRVAVFDAKKGSDCENYLNELKGKLVNTEQKQQQTQQPSNEK